MRKNAENLLKMPTKKLRGVSCNLTKNILKHYREITLIETNLKK